MSGAASGDGAPVRGWQVACGVCAAVALALVLGYALPLRSEAAQLEAERQRLEARSREAQATLDDTRASLERAHQKLAQLDEDAREREAARVDASQRMEKLERELSTQFGRLARADMLLVSSAGDRLSVALAIPALFPLGRTQVTANGRALLCELAQTIMQHHDGQIRVSGYRGSAQPGSPWQLSAARAASAAAVLERDCTVPAERLYAVGYGPRAAGPLGENVALELVFNQRD